MDTDVALPPALNEDELSKLGTSLLSQWRRYVTDRKMIEERWLRNLRQVRKIYDPEVLKLIPSDRSKAYPGLTQWIVRGTIARLMQMLFPQTEKNYGIKASPLPDLSTEQLQQVLDQLVQETMQAQQITDPAQVHLSDDDIEKAIKEFAKGKAEKMETKVDDDLQEMEFITLARKVVRSATIYNIGIAVGPKNRRVKARTWQRNPHTGQYQAVEVVKYKPLYEHLPVWDHYPDMTAASLDKQDGTFDRHIMTRVEIEDLARRPDFMADRVQKFLRDNPGGNYKAQWWESIIKGEEKSGLAPVAMKETRKFEALSFWGAVSGYECRAAGIDIADADVGKSFHVNAWMLNDVVVKMKLAPLGESVRHHHYFVFEDDDLSILGNGQCDVVRDSQVAVNETARATLDNMSVVGPMVEVNTDLLTPGQSMSIAKHKTWYREGEGNMAQIPAVRNITIESHLTELQALLQMWMDFARQESGLPPPSVGDVSQGGSEALRTQQNASMFLGAAALPVRDTVRNYDSFTISLISALVAWNKKFDPNPARDGDHDIIARGSTSLIAKEVRGNALDMFRKEITPDEAPHLKSRALLVERMKAHDLPVDELLEDEDVANQKIQQQADVAMKQQQDQQELVAAQVEEALSNAFKNAALARKADSSITTDVFEALMNALEAGSKSHSDAVKAAATAAAAAKPTGGKQ